MKSMARALQALSRLVLVGSFVLLPLGGIKPVIKSPTSSNTSMTDIALYPNIETVGVVVNGVSLPATAQLMYQQAGETTWRNGHPLRRIDDGRLVGSLFGLSPSTSYNVRVSDGSVELPGSVTTQPDVLTYTPAVTLYVNDDAPAGGNGTTAAPFRSIQEAVNLAGPGTQILVADGIYREGITFPASGSAGNWIQIKAEGNGAILEGAEILSGSVWTADETKKNVYYTKIKGPIAYLARDGRRYYNYDDRNGLMQSVGHAGVSINEGWYLEPSTLRLYVRSLDNPASHAWQVPVQNRAFDVAARDWIWIEGFEIRYYGLRTDGCGVCTLNASHIVIRRNRIHNLQLGIFVNWNGDAGQGNDTRIENNEVSDPGAAEWPWNAIKTGSMEGTAIIARGHIGTIIRGNEIHHFFNGIYSGASGTAGENTGISFDTDIYNNRIHHIGDDGLEPEGACINNRFRGNTVDTSLVGISLAPITVGPVWVLRSYFTNFTGRGIKWDRASDGVVFLYHNTAWTGASSVNAMDLISATRNTVMRNNILQSTGYAIQETPTGSTGNDWNYDNWYTTRTPRFKWENLEYNSISQFCSSTGLECNGHESAPGLNNPVGGDYSILSSSPNVDRGILVPGINDGFAGNAPDIGAFEAAYDPAPNVASITLPDPISTNASVVNFQVTFSEPVTGVDLAAPFTDFVISASPEITGASIASITALSNVTYGVAVNTGNGNGSLRLDVSDNDSIVDQSGNPLGGLGAGNGNYTIGGSYTIFKAAPSIPVVTNMSRLDPSPTLAGVVRFTVTFSEPVTGVDVSDFLPITAGTISGAAISEVIGSGNTYTITMNSGFGDGTLGLSLSDNDSIVNSGSTPLGGAGTGNGNYQAGDVYVIDKNIPVVTGILRSDGNPSGANEVRFLVTFSEPVSGVDAGDFLLSPTGGIAGLQLTAITPSSASQYSVTVATGTGSGTIRLDLIDNDSITDLVAQPLGGSGGGNGNFTTGETYTVNKVIVTTYVATFTSIGGNDGWIMELKENSETGGYRDPGSATLILGDEYHNRQYRSILQFQTAPLPDNAVVTKVTMMIRTSGFVGTNPFLTHGNILVDIAYNAFGTTLFGYPNKSLQNSDFQAPASRDIVGVIQNNPLDKWYWTSLDASAFPFINLTGTTQFRLRFQLDDDNDFLDDFIKFFSGDYSSAGARPQLVVEYYLR